MCGADTSHRGQLFNGIIRGTERCQTDFLRELSEAGLRQQRNVTQQLVARVPALTQRRMVSWSSVRDVAFVWVVHTHGSGVYKGSELWRTYWVQWNTLKARPARKSRGDRYPATGRMVNPDCPARRKHTALSVQFLPCQFLKSTLGNLRQVLTSTITLQELWDVLQLRDVVFTVAAVPGQQREVLQVLLAGMAGIQLV